MVYFDDLVKKFKRLYSMLRKNHKMFQTERIHYDSQTAIDQRNRTPTRQMTTNSCKSFQVRNMEWQNEILYSHKKYTYSVFISGHIMDACGRNEKHEMKITDFEVTLSTSHSRRDNVDVTHPWCSVIHNS